MEFLIFWESSFCFQMKMAFDVYFDGSICLAEYYSKVILSFCKITWDLIMTATFLNEQCTVFYDINSNCSTRLVHHIILRNSIFLMTF